MNEDVRFIRRELTQLRSQLANIESRARQSWSAVPATSIGPTPAYLAVIQNGNTLFTVGSTTVYGLKYPAANVTSIPTIIPSGSSGACPDGLTRAELELTPGASRTVVWVGYRLQPGGTGPVYDDVSGIDIFYQTPVLCRTFVDMPLVSDATQTARVYLPFRF